MKPLNTHIAALTLSHTDLKEQITIVSVRRIIIGNNDTKYSKAFICQIIVLNQIALPSTARVINV